MFLSQTLNDFFARFEAPGGPTRGGDWPRPTPRKAAGPDNVPGRALQACADELTDVLTDIFSISLCRAAVPRCFKTSIIVPVAKKKSAVSRLNDYRPVALTPIVMGVLGTVNQTTQSHPAYLHHWIHSSMPTAKTAPQTTHYPPPCVHCIHIHSLPPSVIATFYLEPRFPLSRYILLSRCRNRAQNIVKRPLSPSEQLLSTPTLLETHRQHKMLHQPAAEQIPA